MTTISGQNQFYNNNWTPQTMQQFTPSFGNSAWTPTNIGNWNPSFGNNWSPMTAFGWGNTTSSSSSFSGAKTVEEIEKEKAEKNKKINQYIEQKTQINAQKAEIDKAKADFDKTKNADGTATVIKDIKEMSLGEKIKRGASNAFIGLGNLCKSLVGYDENGKWDPMKCLRNVAIAAAATAVCVFAAPVAAAAATALGASAATAATAAAVAKGVLVTAPAVAALAGGVVKTGKGLYDACNAETTEQFDRATESVGQGVAITVAAKAGLKSISNSAGLATTQGIKAELTNPVAALKDIFVNPFKAGHIEGVAAVNNISATAASTTSGKLSFLSSVKAGRSGIKNLHADVKMDAFNKNLTNTRKSLAEEALNAEKLAQSTTDPKAKTLYEMQRDHALKCMSDLKKVKNTSDLKAILKSTKDFNKTAKPQHWYNRKGSTFEINGQKYTKAELESVLENSYKLNSTVQNVAKDQFKVMSKVAGSSKYADVVDDFGMSNKWYAQPYNWAMAKYNQGITKGDIFRGAMTVSAPVYALQPALNNPYMTANNIAILADPSYEKPQGDIIAADQVAAQDQQFAQAKANIDTQIENIDKQIKSLA